jgi:hypothetical protein
MSNTDIINDLIKRNKKLEEKIQSLQTLNDDKYLSYNTADTKYGNTNNNNMMLDSKYSFNDDYYGGAKIDYDVDHVYDDDDDDDDDSNDYDYIKNLGETKIDRLYDDAKYLSSTITSNGLSSFPINDNSKKNNDEVVVLRKMIKIQDEIENILKEDLKQLKKVAHAQRQLLLDWAPLILVRKTSPVSKLNDKIPQYSPSKITRRSLSASSFHSANNRALSRGSLDTFSYNSISNDNGTAWHPSSSKANIPTSPLPLPNENKHQAYNNFYLMSPTKKYSLSPNRKKNNRKLKVTNSPRYNNLNNSKSPIAFNKKNKSPVNIKSPKKNLMKCKNTSKKLSAREELQVEVDKILKEFMN